jgi:hypothetical protein
VRALCASRAIGRRRSARPWRAAGASGPGARSGQARLQLRRRRHGARGEDGGQARLGRVLIGLRVLIRRHRRAWRAAPPLLLSPPPPRGPPARLFGVWRRRRHRVQAVAVRDIGHALAAAALIAKQLPRPAIKLRAPGRSASQQDVAHAKGHALGRYA